MPWLRLGQKPLSTYKMMRVILFAMLTCTSCVKQTIADDVACAVTVLGSSPILHFN